MNFSLTYQDLTPSAKARLHEEVMEEIGGKNPSSLEPDYFLQLSQMADEAIEKSLEIKAKVDTKGGEK